MLAMQAELIRQLPVANQLGEGIIWDAQTEALWWVDILGQSLFRYDIEADELSQWQTPEPLCSFALVTGRQRLLAAFASGLAWYNPDAGTVDWLHKIEASNPASRLNDGKTDPSGRFWVGGVVEDTSASVSKTALYRLDADLTLHRMMSDIEISNGLCWSADGRRMYHTDTPTQTIRQFSNDAQGNLGSVIDFANTDEDCFPDGSTTDIQGRVYNAEWGGGKIRCYSSTGAVDADLIMPVKQPTCVAFGGANLDLLCVTSAAVGQNQKGAGDVFIYKTDRQGIEQPRFTPVLGPQ